MTKQKYEIGDLVQIAAYYPWICKGDEVILHRDGAGKRAIILGSYAEQFGGSNTTDYSVFIKGSGRVAWYDEEYMTLIEHDRMDLYRKWRDNHE